MGCHPSGLGAYCVCISLKGVWDCRVKNKGWGGILGKRDPIWAKGDNLGKRRSGQLVCKVGNSALELGEGGGINYLKRQNVIL